MPNDLELDPHLIFYLNGPTSDTNRFDPEILLQHRRRAPINSALSLNLDLHWTSLTMQAQVSLALPTCRLPAALSCWTGS